MVTSSVTVLCFTTVDAGRVVVSSTVCGGPAGAVDVIVLVITGADSVDVTVDGAGAGFVSYLVDVLGAWVSVTVVSMSVVTYSGRLA